MPSCSWAFQSSRDRCVSIESLDHACTSLHALLLCQDPCIKTAEGKGWLLGPGPPQACLHALLGRTVRVACWVRVARGLNPNFFFFFHAFSMRASYWILSFFRSFFQDRFWDIFLIFFIRNRLLGQSKFIHVHGEGNWAANWLAAHVCRTDFSISASDGIHLNLAYIMVADWMGVVYILI